MLMSLPEALLGPVHNAPKKFENAAFFLWLGLPSTLKTVLQRNFSKTLFKPEEFVNATSFLYGGETFWKRRYSTENDGVTIIMRFIWPIFLQTQIQNGRWLLRFSFLRRSADGKHSMRFKVTPPFSYSSSSGGRGFKLRYVSYNLFHIFVALLRERTSQ